MSSEKTQISAEAIESFLSGNNPKKYVISVEASYNEPFANLIVNYPNIGKKIEKHTYKPFLWYKEDILPILYEGKKVKQMEAAGRYGVSTKRLKISDADGYIPDRLQNGYKFLVTCTKSYNNLVLFFKEGGIDIFDKQYSKNFFMFTPVEQFMIQTGIRLFKGMDDYDDLHRFQFDLETEGLFASKNAIFQIGMRDNRGFEMILETLGNTPQEGRDSERNNIIDFFETIRTLKPDLITGYNSESFDWTFILERCDRLNIPIDLISKGLDGKTKLKRKPSMLKLGNEQEEYLQTHMFGHNIIDIAHSVRRAQAINSDIKGWSLKYITQYSEVAKKNRVYIQGDKINTIWSDKVNKYAFNDANGDWFKISEKMKLKDGYKLVRGNYIVQRYLLDDLWETEQIDMIFNQASFLIAKLLPTTYGRSSTMGTATQWKLIMAAWSYENNLGIPATEPKREFTGGLSRLLELGYARNVVKLDYAALYPKNQITHKIFPKLDISGVMEGLLTYIVDTRDKFKFLTGSEKKLVKSLVKNLEIEGNSAQEIEKFKKDIKTHKDLANLYDKKQLPLKILANSWFGAYGAPYIFNWGDTDCAEETTCRGRQYLRLMVRHFCGKYGFKALLGDTDGFNFSFPDTIDNVRYVAKGSHWKTKEDAGIELVGLEAVLAEFNENYMIGRMGLDIDDICNSTINFSRKNYANDIGGKIKLVGNSIKSKKMPLYIEEFLGKAIRMLLDGNGKDFINYYYEYVDKIYNYNIPLVKIAYKSRVKSSISEYKKRALKKNKAGNPLPKQAHMELAMNANLDIQLGDTLYYVNTGTAKNQGDIKTEIKNKMTKKQINEYFINNGKMPQFEKELKINCKLIDLGLIDSNLGLIKEIEVLRKTLIGITDAQKQEEINAEINELDSQLLTDEYNVPKYLEAFNKKVTPLLVCFNTETRKKILLKIVKNKTTKLSNLAEKNFFSNDDCMLVSGIPNNPEDQDTYEELMTMEDKEIKFWDKVNKIPNNMEEDEWEAIRADYHVRKAIEKENGIVNEKAMLDEIFKYFELEELRTIERTLTIPNSIIMIANVDDNGNFVSRKWGELLCHVNSIFNYEKEAIARNKWYQENNITKADKYDLWLSYISEQEIMDLKVNVETEMKKNIEPIIAKIKEISNEFELPVTEVKKETDEDDDDDDEYDPNRPESDVDGYNSDIQRADFEIELKNVTIDSIIKNDDDYVNDLFDSLKSLTKEHSDEWNF